MKIIITQKQKDRLYEQLLSKPPQEKKTNFYLPKPIKAIGDFITDSINLIKKHEGFCDNVKRKCPSHTIGYGTRTDLHPELKNKPIDDNTATLYIKKDLESQVIPAIKRLVKTQLSPNQTAALSSLIYNIGPGNFAKSQLLKDLNSGNMEGVRKNWEEFNKSEGKQLGGLVSRRWDEIKLFFGK